MHPYQIFVKLSKRVLLGPNTSDIWSILIECRVQVWRLGNEAKGSKL